MIEFSGFHLSVTIHAALWCSDAGDRVLVGADGREPGLIQTYCWWFRNPAKQLRLVVSPIFYKVLYIPGGAGFLSWWLNHLKNMIVKLDHLKPPASSTIAPPKEKRSDEDWTRRCHFNELEWHCLWRQNYIYVYIYIYESWTTASTAQHLGEPLLHRFYQNKEIVRWVWWSNMHQLYDIWCSWTLVSGNRMKPSKNHWAFQLPKLQVSTNFGSQLKNWDVLQQPQS